MSPRYKASDADDERAPRRRTRGAVPPRAQAAPQPRRLVEREGADYSDIGPRDILPPEEGPVEPPLSREYHLFSGEEGEGGGSSGPPPHARPRHRSATPPPLRSDPGDDDGAFGFLGSGSYRPAEPSARPLPPSAAPWETFRRPPKKGMSAWRALWLILSFPFRVIAFLTRRAPRMILLPLRILISFCFVGFVALFLIAVFYGIKAGRYDVTQVLRMPERSIVLDRKGNEIGTLHGENRRSITNLHEEVPRYFIDALIIQEDRSFWKHGGVDPRGVLRAIGQVIKHHHATQGASTITMQLAKNTYNHRVRNLDAKLTEVALARRIEATYDKETILTCYINRVFWGHTFLGLKQAAYGYFSKQPRDLTIGEAAMLAGIVCSPNEFSPYRNPSSAKIQRDKVLKLLHDNGYITRNEYETALAEPIVTRMPERRGNDNYALDLIRSEVDHIFSMLDASEQNVKDQLVYSGGLVIRTTLDVDLQDDAMHEMDARLTDMFEKKPRYRHQTRAQFQAKYAALRERDPNAAERLRPEYLQAACVIIDNATGALLAVVGGRDSRESPLNRAVQSRRQVGSLFKPIVYATYFERGYGANSQLSDDRLRPGEIPGARRWSPGNADGRYTGLHPAGWGLLKSRNTMSVRAGVRAGLENVTRAALLAGFPPTQRRPGPTIYLGTWEASPLEVAGAYTLFANGGVRPTPYIIESITDDEGHVIWQNRPSARRVFSQHTTELISAILQKITKPGGTAGRMQQLGFKAPAGGKTGTTNSYKNAWFCGFTSNLTTAVWVGFDRPRTIADRAYGGTVALPLWVGIMQKAQQRGYAMGDIRTTPAAPRSVGLRLCRISGALAHSGCEHEGTAYTDSMVDFNQPRELCTLHHEYVDSAPGSSRPIDPDTAVIISDDVAEDPEDPSGDEDIAVDPEDMGEDTGEDIAEDPDA